MEGVEVKALNQSEMLTGMQYAQLISLAQARVQTLVEAQGVFVSHLSEVHGAGDGWELQDWAVGFVRPVVAEAEVVEDADEAEEVESGD